MKNLLKGYEVLSQVFMYGFLVLFMLALKDGTIENSRDSYVPAVQLLVISMVFIITTSWTHSACYINWKQRNNYE